MEYGEDLISKCKNVDNENINCFQGSQILALLDHSLASSILNTGLGQFPAPQSILMNTTEG